MNTDSGKEIRNHDLEPATLDAVAQSSAEPAAYLLEMRSFVESRALDAIDWYYKRKGPISIGSKVLRIGAIVFATVGGVLPLVAATPLLDGPHGDAAGNYGYVFLALAGASVLSDKLFGLSSRWMHFMTTAMALQRHLAEFEMAWAAEWLEVADGNPTDEQRARLVALLRDFRRIVVAEVEKETQQWVAEFESGIAQLERQAKLEQQVKSDSTTAEVRARIAASTDGAEVGVPPAGR